MDPLEAIGEVGGSRLSLVRGKESLNLGLAELEHAFTHAFDVLDKS